MQGSRFTSRKFLVAVGTILSLLLKEFTGLSLEPVVVGGIIGVAGVYILGEAAIDFKAVAQKIIPIIHDEFLEDFWDELEE